METEGNEKLLNFELHGEGELFILIHGLDSAMQTFFPIIETICKNFRVLLIDQLGHGSSPECEDQDYSLGNQAKALFRLLQHLNLQTQKAIILGHSFGARTAFQFAKEYPQNVRALIIEDMDFINKSRGSLEAALAASKEKRKRIRLEDSYENMRRNLINFYGNHQAEYILEKRAIVKGSKVLLLFKPWVTPIYAYFSAKSDFTQFLWENNFPILFICADSFGSAVSYDGLKEIKRLTKKKDSQVFLSQIKGAGHNVHGTKKEEFLTALYNFLSRTFK